MSNPLDENNRPMFLDPEPQGPTSEQLRQRALQGQDIPAFTQQNVDLAAALQPHMETLVALTAQMSQNFEGINSLLQNNAEHLDSIGRKQRQNSQYTTDEYNRQKKINDTHQERERIMQRINNAEAKSTNALATQFRFGNMMRNGQIEYLDQSGRLARTTVEQYQRMPAARRQSIREQLATNIQSRQERGDATFSVQQTIQHLAHGQIGSAVGELLQSFPFTQGITNRLQTIGEARMAQGAEALSAGTWGGLVRGGSQFALGGVVGHLLPFLSTPAGIYTLQRELRAGVRNYQQDLRQGMQTGLTGTAAVSEAVGGGIRARVEGLNPFDALTTQMARQIAAGINSEGFAGSIRAAWQDAVTNVVKSTGIDAGTALQLMSTSANRLGESATQFRQDMNLVENAAKNTSFSVTQLAQNMQQLQQSFVQGGGVQAAAPAGQLANTLQNALGNTRIGRIALGGLTSTLAQPQVFQQAVAMAGINPLLANTEQVLQQAPRILDQYGARLWTIKNQGSGRTLDLHTWVVTMYGAGLFQSLMPGADEATVEEFMRITAHGGLERTQRAHTAENAPGPVSHHRGFLGGIIHGAAHMFSQAGHTIETGINAPGQGLGWLTTQTLGSLGVSDRTARMLGGGLADQLELPTWARSTIINDYDVGATRRSQAAYWRDQAQRAGLTASETRRLLQPTQQAGSIEQLTQANQQAQTIIVKLHPSAARYFTAEPGSVQTYYNSLNGASGTQYMTRPPGS